ncbi:hypothetical protein JS533_006260 [Bifidobacterium amazonense]|uniref:Uncharacterized protein n=1 Tax=Bifidobacterium amazonense TaxID=2809027 RepID=A0ABS9VUU5_9BIFI|nr:hypothetical protein [Bifidobacterium amazonense]MCH9275875.1 hypothetical protein [Bifidobacterium amazonense]
MAKRTSRKARNEWVRQALETHRAQLREREIRTAALYDAITAFIKALDTARPLIQDFTRDYGVPRSEIGKQFGLTPRQLSALFESPHKDVRSPGASTHDDGEGQTERMAGTVAAETPDFPHLPPCGFAPYLDDCT